MDFLFALLPALFGGVNLHPMVIHFPVVLFPLACLLHFVGKKQTWQWASPAGRWALWLGTFFAVIAIVTGFFAANNLGHNQPGHEIVHIHRNLMIATGVISLILSVFVIQNKRNSSQTMQWFIGFAHILLTMVLVLGSDRGASLVYQYGFGVQNIIPSDFDHPLEHSHSH